MSDPPAYRGVGLLAGLMLGSTYSGTDSPSIYDRPPLPVAVTLVWKRTAIQPNNGLSIDSRFGSDLSGQSTFEDQPVSMLGLALWKQQMYNRTDGLYVKRVKNATLAALTYDTSSGNLTITLQGLNNGTATVRSYSGDIPPPITFTVGSGRASYNSTSKMVAVAMTLTSSGAGSIIITNPNESTSPNSMTIHHGVSPVVLGSRKTRWP